MQIKRLIREVALKLLIKNLSCLSNELTLVQLQLRELKLANSFELNLFSMILGESAFVTHCRNILAQFVSVGLPPVNCLYNYSAFSFVLRFSGSQINCLNWLRAHIKCIHSFQRYWVNQPLWRFAETFWRIFVSVGLPPVNCLYNSQAFSFVLRFSGSQINCLNWLRVHIKCIPSFHRCSAFTYMCICTGVSISAGNSLVKLWISSLMLWSSIIWRRLVW